MITTWIFQKVNCMLFVSLRKTFGLEYFIVTILLENTDVNKCPLIILIFISVSISILYSRLNI